MFYQEIKIRRKLHTNCVEITLGTIPILCQQKDWVGGSRKKPDLLTFSTVFMLIRWVGRVQKGQKYADVIQGWSLRVTQRLLIPMIIPKILIQKIASFQSNHIKKLHMAFFMNKLAISCNFQVYSTHEKSFNIYFLLYSCFYLYRAKTCLGLLIQFISVACTYI